MHSTFTSGTVTGGGGRLVGKKRKKKKIYNVDVRKRYFCFCHIQGVLIYTLFG